MITNDSSTVSGGNRGLCPKQEPLAIVGFACRLPGNCNTPKQFWDFIVSGGVASRDPPETRFNLDTHYDGSKKPGTMASPGGMFINGDPRDIDASFFKLTRTEATATDPQQRQLLEVVYEGLENCGITLEELDGADVGCFVSSFACDYADIQARDPTNRAHMAITGLGRALLSNRISHFLNIKGPSITMDTACSGSLVAVDVANRYLQTREISGAIVAGCNLYMSPEHVTDPIAAQGTASGSGFCHTWDPKADGYIKAEGVNMVFLKRLDDAVKDGNPIRGIIRGTATGSDGWTPGIGSPSSEAQATTVRQAYANAHIADMSATGYVECHGTGTQAGDAAEVNGIASVFAPSRSDDLPLRIGSVKSNIGHSEPAAGISGLLKATLLLQTGIIPGNPTFETPNPKIDFQRLKVLPSKGTTKWPASSEHRRAGVNSFGYGGSNAHAIIENVIEHHGYVTSYSDGARTPTESSVKASRPYILALSANDDVSLRSYTTVLKDHLSKPDLSVAVRDVAYTLSEKRTKHFHRSFLIARNGSLQDATVVTGKTGQAPPRIGLVFTGQGAQWPQMGRDLISTCPVAVTELKHLNTILQALSDPPQWNLITELTEPRTLDQYKSPELSQTLTTALQLALLSVLKSCNVEYQAVVGHSSGEIVAAAAAGYLTHAQAIQIAYYRGKAASQLSSNVPLGMMAVGLSKDQVEPLIIFGDKVQVACVNSPSSVTLSGVCEYLQPLETTLKSNGHFARMLAVDAAYHSSYMEEAATLYRSLMERNINFNHKRSPSKTMYSSVTGTKLENDVNGSEYWVRNMVSPVLFDAAVKELLKDPIDMLIELGPSGALAGPIAQIKQANTNSAEYAAVWKRGAESADALCDVVGRLFIKKCPVNLTSFNKDNQTESPQTVIDLPNYCWNHSTKYWHETAASKDWRFRKFLQHDLLGMKVLGTPWMQPTFQKTLKLKDLAWLEEHRIDGSPVFPAVGYIAMATEAIYQVTKVSGLIPEAATVRQIGYRLRNLKFLKAIVLSESVDQDILLTMNPRHGSKDAWYEFSISTRTEDALKLHACGQITISKTILEDANPIAMQPIQHGEPGQLWYKINEKMGFYYGPNFQNMVTVEATAGSRQNRVLVKLDPPKLEHESTYPIHPVVMDVCFQSINPSLYRGMRSQVSSLLIPTMVDDMFIPAQPAALTTGMIVGRADFAGTGRTNDPKSYASSIVLYDLKTGGNVFQMQGLRHHQIDRKREAAGCSVYYRLLWQPDISLLSRSELSTVILEGHHQTVSRRTSHLSRLLDLIAYKTPDMKVLELSLLDEADSVWIDGRDCAAFDRASCSSLKLLTMSEQTSQDISARYSSLHNVDVGHLHEMVDVGTDGLVDLIIVRHAVKSKLDSQWIAGARRFLKANGKLLILGTVGQEEANQSLTTICEPTPHPSPDLRLFQTLEDCGLSIAHQGFQWSDHDIPRPMQCVLALNHNNAEVSKAKANPKVSVAHFFPTRTERSESVAALSKLGWRVIEHQLPFLNIAPKSTVIVFEETPIFPSVTGQQWNALRELLQNRCRVLWVTQGSQMHVTHPSCSLMHGLAWTICNEEPSTIIVTLDVESLLGVNTARAVDKVLRRLTEYKDSVNVDTEFVERGGILYVGRVVPDELINEQERVQADHSESEPKHQNLFTHPSQVRLISANPGTLDSLCWSEQSSSIDTAIGERHVEVEMHSVGLNFKDVAVSMGLVPADEHLLGLEGAGTIHRVGSSASTYTVGQRVVVNIVGTLANKVQCPEEEIHAIPDWMSFEEASTLGVYQTALYCLVDLADTQKGSSVLIHSAAGGVGLAAIQLCQHLGAEIYATVGTDTKRKYLVEEYGIPKERIFSSRSPDFESQLMKATHGRGVDVVLNSLTGEILHASWRCIATGGTFVEIGKKDILDGSSISMEPFSRGASYRAFDYSHSRFTPALRYNILARVFKLVAQRHVKPLYIEKTFAWKDVNAAFRHMASGSNIGKTIITRSGDQEESVVSIHLSSTALELNPQSSYLVVGGLKGLCGSLAIYLAFKGATNLVVLSRSGYEDDISQGILKDVENLGAKVDLVVGDVTKRKDIERMFQSASKPIRGIIQGAMVLRDRIYNTMTVEEFQETLPAKVQGTWTLHNVALDLSIELDFFTLLSSISGIVGSKGQANYSAANAFLDSFAHYRHRLGLPACSVNLGVIEDVGYVSGREALAKHLYAQGWPPVMEATLHRILSLSILQQAKKPINPESSAQLVTGLPLPLPAHSPAQRDPRFSALRFSSTGDIGEAASNSSTQSSIALLRKAWKDAASDVENREELVQLVIDLANQKLMRSLGMDEDIHPSRPLDNYGVNSLVAVEFRNWARTDLGVEITTMEFVGAKTLSSLSELIFQRGLQA